MGDTASKTLWEWSELCRATGVSEVSGPSVTGISIDTRTLDEGDLFVALKGNPGPRFRAAVVGARDGHDFVADAAARGAAGALVHRGVHGDVDVALPLLRVNDTLDGLWDLARHARNRNRGQIVAVTGSSGKTTAKDFLATMLDAHAAEGSFNNFWGVPVSLARMPRDAKFSVFELGTNHPGEIGPLAELVKPDVALVLNVLPVHIGFFTDLDDLRLEKLAIVDGLDTTATLVLPAGLSTKGVRWKGPTVSFGQAEGDVQLTHLERESATIKAQGRELTVRVPGGGVHRGLTITACCALCVALGVELDGVVERLASVEVPRGRGNVLRLGNIVLVDDSYNANPESVRQALVSLAASNARRKIAVLGDMLELGDEESAMHRGLATSCMGLDGVVCVGERMRNLYDALPEAQRLGWFEAATDETLVRLCALIESGDEVLVKGSNRIFWAVGFAERLAGALAESS